MTTLSLPQLIAPATGQQWFDFLLATSSKLGLPATDWEPGAPTRTTFVVFANALMLEDIDASLIAQAGSLDYAASGSVTYVDVDGVSQTVLVTPDPSVPAQNPTAALGALDVLADAVYDVQRIMAAAAGGTLAIINTSATTYTYAAGAYHVAQPSATGSPTYSNAAALSIAPTAAVATVSATANSGGLVRITCSAAHGLATDDVVVIAGVGGTTEANGAWLITKIDATKFTLQGSVYANAWTSGGLVYTPVLAPFTADNAGTASSAIANRVTQAVTSLVGVSVSNYSAWIGTDTENNATLAGRCRLKLQALSPGGPSGAYVYFSLTAYDLAPGLTPALALSAPITRALSVPSTRTGTVTVTIANAAGAPSGDMVTPGTDVYACHAVLTAWAKPLATTLVTQSANEVTVNVGGSVWVPAAQRAAAQVIVDAVIAAYFATFPVAGISNPGGASNVIPINGIESAVTTALAASSIVAQDIALTFNSAHADVALALSPYPEIAKLGTMTAAAVGV